MIEPSRYNILNIASILFIATTIWSLVLAIAAPGIPASIAPQVRTLFALVALGLVASIYFLSKRRLWAPLLGLTASAAGLVVFAAFRYPSFNLADYALTVVLVADIALGWLARERIKGIIEQQWHPLDMPAYG